VHAVSELRQSREIRAAFEIVKEVPIDRQEAQIAGEFRDSMPRPDFFKERTARHE
jgi:hypothetical protein